MEVTRMATKSNNGAQSTDAPVNEAGVDSPGTETIESTKLTAIVELTGRKFGSDNSKIGDGTLAANEFNAIVDLLPDYAERSSTLELSSVAIGLHMVRIRQYCLRSDGTPDWAGRSRAYSVLFQDRITSSLEEEFTKWYSDESERKSRIADFRQNTRKAISRYNLVKLVAAEYHMKDGSLGADPTATKSDSGKTLTNREVVETAVDGILAGVKPSGKLSVKLTNAIDRDWVKQKSTTTGKRYPSFQSKVTSDLANNDPDPTGDTGGNGNGEATPAAAWSQVHSDQAKISPLAHATNLAVLATDMSDRLVGPIGKSQPKSVKQWSEVKAELECAIEVLQRAIAVRDGKSGVDKDSIVKYRRTDLFDAGK